MSITETEILEQIRQSIEGRMLEHTDDNSMTVPELCKALGLGEKAVRRHLKPLIASGDVRAVRSLRVNMAGVITPVPAYKIA